MAIAHANHGVDCAIQMSLLAGTESSLIALPTLALLEWVPRDWKRRLEIEVLVEVAE